MSEDECRHLPAPAWNPARCGRCGATLPRTPGPDVARLLSALRPLADWQLYDDETDATTLAVRGAHSRFTVADVKAARAAIAEHESARPESAQPGPTDTERLNFLQRMPFETGYVMLGGDGIRSQVTGDLRAVIDRIAEHEAATPEPAQPARPSWSDKL